MDDIQRQLSEIQTNVAVIKEKITNIEEHLDGYVTRTEFEPVKKLFYGLVALVMTGVVGAVLALVVGG